ncbi:hypothetical protein ACVGOW_04030 [Pseudonocardia saturnea]
MRFLLPVGGVAEERYVWFVLIAGWDGSAGARPDRLHPGRAPPLSMWAAKQAAHRLRRAGLPDGDDLVEGVSGSADFVGAGTAFTAGERPSWTGR